MFNLSRILFTWGLLLFVQTSFAQEKDCQPEFKINHVSTYPCLPVTELGFPQTVNGVAVEFYRYKVPWAQLSTEQLDFLRATESSLQQSISEFKKYASVPPLKILFTNEFPLDSENKQAEAHWPESNKPSCEIIIYMNTDTNLTSYKQVMAHEIAHCLQGQNIKNLQKGYYAGYSWWWVEGGADYLANVAYPTVDEERPKQALYNPEKPLYDQPNGYSASLFFQFMENKGWNPKTYFQSFQNYPLLNTAADLNTALGIMSSWPNIAEHFHYFVRTLFSLESITDTSGKSINIHFPDQPEQTFAVHADTTQIKIKAATFKSNFAVLVFSDAGKYRMKMAVQDHQNMYVSYRKYGTRDWILAESLTTELEVECAGDEITAYEFLVTSTHASIIPTELTVEIEVAEAKPCECLSPKPALDPCLIGQWELDMDNYRAAVQPVFGGQMLFDGGYSVNIQQGEGKVNGLLKDFSVTIPPILINPNPQTYSPEYKSVYNGKNVQTYYTQSAHKICGRLDGQDLVIDNYENGSLIDSQQEVTPADPTLAGVTYFCSGKTLNLKIPMPGMQSVGDRMILFRKK